MRASIVGAGAIGGWLGGLLADAGWQVSLLARGRTLDSVRNDGLRLRTGGKERTYRLIATEHGAQLGPQDYVILALKGQDLAAAVPSIVPMLGAETTIVTAMNGLPWWFTRGLDGPLTAAPLASVDPDGTIARALNAFAVVGCVIHASAYRSAPGVIELVKADRLTFGAPTGQPSVAAERLAAAFAASGVEARATTMIRDEIWAKLWGNMTMNPLSMLTGASTGRMLDDPDVAGVCLAMMQEFARLGEVIGISLPMTAEQRMGVTRKLGDFRTSMLQDFETGRPLELDPIIGAVVELAERVGQPVPFIRAIYGLARQRAISSGLYGGA